MAEIDEALRVRTGGLREQLDRAPEVAADDAPPQGVPIDPHGGHQSIECRPGQAWVERHDVEQLQDEARGGAASYEGDVPSGHQRLGDEGRVRRDGGDPLAAPYRLARIQPIKRVAA